MRQSKSADALDAPLPPTFDLLDTPAVLVDMAVLRRNLKQVTAICQQRRADLRPHAKSHKSRDLTQMQLEQGAVGITVAKLDEACALAANGGCEDIFLAYPVTSVQKAARGVELAQEVRMTFAVDTLAGAEVLNEAASTAGILIRVLIEIDSGLARCGVRPAETEGFAQQLRELDHLDVVGVFTHAGHAYGAGSGEELRRIAEREVSSVVQAADGATRAGANVQVISVGSTPTILTNVAALQEVTELRPGNYIFKDRMQVALGVAAIEECALSVLTTVASTATGNAVIDAGSKTLGLDRGAHGIDAMAGYGIDVSSDQVVDRLSEEHGVIEDGARRYRPGDRLRLIPNHACVVTDRAATLYAVQGQEVVGSFSVDVRGGGR